MSCPRPKLDLVASAGRARLGAAGLLVGGRSAELVVVEAGAGEVRLIPTRRAVAVAQLLAGEVEHERGVDDPDLADLTPIGPATARGREPPLFAGRSTNNPVAHQRLNGSAR